MFFIVPVHILGLLTGTRFKNFCAFELQSYFKFQNCNNSVFSVIVFYCTVAEI